MKTKEEQTLKEKEYSFAFNKEGEWEEVEKGDEYCLSKDIALALKKLKEEVEGLKTHHYTSLKYDINQPFSDGFDKGAISSLTFIQKEIDEIMGVWG